ncbi:MAG: ABC transporter ATP-binding protein [Candidatus Eisenbacteria bacterium]
MEAESADRDTGIQTMLEVIGLTKDYGPVRAVDRLSFQVRRGEIVGLLGPNGAGKTTAMRVLIGYQVPTAGEVRLAGRDVFRDGPEAKRFLGYLPENPPLYGEMRVSEYRAMAARLKGLEGSAIGGALERVRGMLGLAEVWRRPISNLSRGFRQRVGLGQCLVNDPALLVLDEPATGLDPNQIADLRALLLRWRGDKGVLLSTHILAEALMLCDRVLVLSRGHLVAEGDPQTLGGESEGRTEIAILVQGGRGDPRTGPAVMSRMIARQEEPRHGTGATGLPVWRLEGSLDRQERLQLLSRLAEGGWDLMEWNAGLSALERSFRRLTLEEGSERREDE